MSGLKVDTVAGLLVLMVPFLGVLSHRAARHVSSQLAATQAVWMALLGFMWMLFSGWVSNTLQTLVHRLDAP
jgi:hypothetical protein